MIIIRVEVHSAKTGEITEIARMKVVNTGTSKSLKLGDYEGYVFRKPTFSHRVRKGSVKGHRRQDLPVWNLIGKMLKSMGYVK